MFWGPHTQRRHRKRQGRQPVVDARQNQPGNHCPGKAQAQQGAHAFPAADGHHRGGKHRQDQHQYRGAVVIVYGIVSIRAVGQVLTDNGGGGGGKMAVSPGRSRTFWVRVR